MTDIINHRGPDDEGFVVFPDYNGSDPICLGGDDTPNDTYHSNLASSPVSHISACLEKKVSLALGHRRLSILDLSRYGHQPMCSHDKTLWITYNGEIYNYVELRDELSKLGYHFNSTTDTEVILAAYKEWGIHCLNRFNGMWAFVIYDEIKKEVFIARDRFGIKPLYYWFDPSGRFYFASEIKQFTACRGWKAVINSQRVYDYLVYSLTDHTDETMFKGVNHIPPGCYYKAAAENIIPDENGKICPVRWYELSRKPSRLTLEEASKDFEKYFKDAVQLHLRSDVPVGSALSGGLDSSAIVCEINNILSENNKNSLQKTFSSCSKFEKYDERKWMDIVINHSKIDAYYTYPETDDLLNLTSIILWHQDEPYQSQSTYLGYHVFQLAKENQVKVLLNGQGADEYLGGYHQFNNAIYYQLFKSLRWNTLYKEAKSLNGRSVYSLMLGISYLLVPDVIRKFIIGHISSVTDIKQLIDLKALGANNLHPFTSINTDLNSVPGITRLNLFHTPLGKYLRWEDRNSMAHSIEARVPFLDYRLVEFTYNLPSDYIFSQGITKRVMRDGLKNILPAEIANRKDKKGFITPEEQWVKNECSQMFREKLIEAISLSKGIIKKDALQYFDDIITGDKPFDYTYIRLILFAEWASIFKMEY